MTYYTHAGLFHADEVMGYAIAATAWVADRANRLTDIENLPTDGIIADIGRVYDPGHGRFDHHQGGLFRPDGYPYASAGLLWKEYGLRAVANTYPTHSRGWHERIAARVDEVLIKGIDAHDSDSEYTCRAFCSAGEVRALTFSEIIAGMNTEGVKDELGQYSAFTRAATFAQKVLLNTIDAAASFISAQDQFEALATVLETDSGGEIITLEHYVPWKEIVCERYPMALYVVCPSSHPGSPWSLLAVPEHPASRSLKHPIQRVAWFDGFIHDGKFIAGCQSKEEAIRLGMELSANWPAYPF